MQRIKSNSLAAAVMLAAMSAMPAGFGQQQKLTTQPGSAYVRTRDRHSFWGGPEKRKPRARTPEQTAKHAAKLMRRRDRFVRGLVRNPCVTPAEYQAATDGLAF